MQKILIIEDDPRVSSLLCKGILEAGYVVESAESGKEGLQKALMGSFDLVVSDIMLPDLDGISLCKELKLQKPQLPIIMLTALGTTDDKVQGFDSGADDYMVKPFEIRELMARIQALLRRYAGVSPAPDILKYADLELDTSSKSALRAGKKLELTAKEYKLLHYLLQNPERVLSRDEIAAHVWDTHFDTGTNFIDVYINYLRKKVDKPFESKLIHTRTGLGFVLQKQEEL